MLEKHIRKFFATHGRFCADHPTGVFVVAALFCAVAMIGITRIRIEQSPVNLWVEPQSRTFEDMTSFNKAFKPFFRVEEVVLSSKTGDNVVSNAALSESLVFHNKLHKMKDPVSGVSLEDICWRPLPGKGCLAQTWLNYIQESNTTFHERVNMADPNAAANWLFTCVSNPISQPCFSALDLPTEPITVFGRGELHNGDHEYSAEATLMSYLIENSNDETYVAAVRSWEKNVFLKLAREWHESSSEVAVNYMAQRSVQDALVAEESDHSSIIFSYVGMFVYITIALGYFSKIHSKMSAALVGIFIVIISIGSSVGFCSTLGVPLTLIIVDVIPFLLVAIGVDNMFIISNEFWFRCRVQLRKQGKGKPLDSKAIGAAMSEALGEVGGTIFLAGASEGLAFSLGALTSMPAVRAFCLYSGVAILVNLGLQVTVFVAFLTLDARRAFAGRWDTIPCLRHPLTPEEIARANPMDEDGQDDPDYNLLASPLAQQPSMNGEDAESFFPAADSQRCQSLSSASLLQLKDVNSVANVSAMQLHKERIRDKGFYSFSGLIRAFMRKYYVPKFLFKKPVQIIVVLLFIVQGFCMLFIESPKDELGLQTTDPIPDHYYLRTTLESIEKYLQVGPLIYFASPAPGKPLVNYSHPDVFGVMDTLFDTLRQETAYIEPSTVASWYNDFRYFLCQYHDIPPTIPGQPRNPLLPVRNFTIGDGCIDLPKLGVDSSNANQLFSCEGKAMKIPHELFIPALKQFLNAPKCCYEAGTNTGICGFQYGQEVIIGKARRDRNGDMYALSDDVLFPSNDTFEYVTGARVRAQTVRLSTNRDYIASLGSAYNASDSLNPVKAFKDAGVSLFPYSIYFVFYSQYLTLPSDAAQQVSIAVAAVLVVTFLVLSSLSSTVSITLCIVLILINMTALMHWFSIDINAISVVNLVMCVGISVEFCAHIAVAFCGTKGPIRRRMMAAMVDMGSNVVCGITITKLLGVSILALSPSEVFRKYYFKMYASMVLLGALHGLLFLPCLLLLIGSSLRQRRYKFATL